MFFDTAMRSEPENMDVLQNLESTVMAFWQEHRDMTDYAAARAYEAAFEHYRAQTRGHQPKPCALTGLDRELYEAVMRICESRLGRPGQPDPDGDQAKCISVAELTDCLRRLRKSVECHTKNLGRQGYLTFVSQFVR